MIRCIGERDGERCHRYTKYIILNGAEADPNFVFKCDSCTAGNKPYTPRDSVRKGQQKQTKK